MRQYCLSKRFNVMCIWASFWENRFSVFLTRSGTIRAEKSLKTARDLTFWIWKDEGLYYSFSVNKGADQLCGYREADLLLWFRICKNPLFPERGSSGDDVQWESSFIAVYWSCHIKGKPNLFSFLHTIGITPIRIESVKLSIEVP